MLTKSGIKFVSRVAVLALTMALAMLAGPWGTALAEPIPPDASNPITNVSINGGDPWNVVVGPDETFTLSLAYYVDIPDGSSAIKQVEIGYAIAPGPAACAYDGVPRSVSQGGTTGTWAGSLTAPTEPGSYTIIYDHALQLKCAAISGLPWWNPEEGRIPIGSIEVAETIPPVILYSSVQSGEWCDPGVWDWGDVPPPGADVAIMPGHMVTLDCMGQPNYTADVIHFSIAEGATLHGGTGNVLHVKGNWEQNGAHEPGTGKVILDGPGQQSIYGMVSPTFSELVINQQVLLEQGIRVKGHLKLGEAGAIDVAGRILALEGDLIDDSLAPEVIGDSQLAGPDSGKVMLDGDMEQKVKSEEGKAAETKIDAKVEAKQLVKLEKHVRLLKQLKLSKKSDGTSMGKVDIAGKNLLIESDLIDDSDAPEAIQDSLGNGKVVLDGDMEQKVKSEEGKTAETKIDANVEANQLVKLEKHVRLLKPLKLSYQRLGWGEGQIDLGGKRLALESDLVDESPAWKGVINSASLGEVLLEGATDQRIKSDIKTGQLQIDATVRSGKSAGKLLVAKQVILDDARFGVASLSQPQEVELYAPASFKIAQTVQAARFKQAAGTGTQLKAMLNSTPTTITLTTYNQVLVQLGSLAFVVEAGDPVVGTVGDVTYIVPPNTAVRIEEPVAGQFIIENTSTLPDAGEIEVSLDGETITVGPGESFANLVIEGPTAPLALGVSADITVRYRDGTPIPAELGHSIAWGDGQATQGMLDPVTGMISASHLYASAGVYEVSATVYGDEGEATSASLQYVVVYDPSAGFVTGGGWIQSPTGAYALEPTLAGKATFGFVSKYKKGATTPSGETAFEFRTADLSFHSEAYQWLVISGARAQFKGAGTINGTSGYGFMLTAIDGDVKGGGGIDRFRIKIWDQATEEIVYDNMMAATDDAAPTTALGGGSIVIHAK